MAFTQPICTECWDKRNPGREPVRLNIRETERCCWCGIHNRSGIYVRADPAKVPYPRGASE